MACPEPLKDTDQVLLERARSGDRSALDALIERYQAKVYRLALRLTGDEHEAEEALQDTFLQVVKKLATFRGEAQFSTWLYRVAANTALMRIRARQQHPASSLETYLPQFDQSGLHRRLDVDYSVAGRVEELIERRQRMRLIHEALARLPEIYRVAFVLYDLEELSASEAAKIAGVDPAAIRQRVHRARLMLRGYLGRVTGGEQ